MKKVFTVFIALVAVIITTETFGQNFVHVNKTNAGQVISLSSDQVLEINLPEIPSSGYTWCEANSSLDDKTASKTIIRIGENDFIENPLSGKLIKNKLVGQSGTRIIRYVGTLTGTTELKLELRRP